MDGRGVGGRLWRRRGLCGIPFCCTDDIIILHSNYKNERRQKSRGNIEQLTNIPKTLLLILLQLQKLHSLLIIITGRSLSQEHGIPASRILSRRHCPIVAHILALAIGLQFVLLCEATEAGRCMQLAVG